MAETTRVPCPKCGGQMNRHAEKVDYGAAPAQTDPRFEGAVMEFFTCPSPKCRFVLERPAR
jgi:hypothetical protein